MGPAGRLAVRPVRRATGSCPRAPTTPPTSGCRSRRPDRPAGGDAVVPDVLRPRGRLRLHVRRDPHRRPGRLDDARRTKNGLNLRRRRACSCPSTGDGSELAVAAPVPGALPDEEQRRLRVHARRARTRRVVGRDGQLGRLEAVGARRPGRLPRQERRDLDHGRDRPGQPGPRRVDRRRQARRRGGDRRCPTRRSRPTQDGWAVGPPPPAGDRQTQETGWERAQTRAVRRGLRHRRPRTRSTPGSAWRRSRAPTTRRR